MAFAFSGSTLATLTITASGTETTLDNLAALINGVTTAARSTAYTLGTIKNAGNGNGYWYLCTTAGTTSATAPTWPTADSSTVVDGFVTWTAFKQCYVLDTGLKKYINIGRCLFRFAASANIGYDVELYCIVGNSDLATGAQQVRVPTSVIFSVGVQTASPSDANFYRYANNDGLILAKDSLNSGSFPIIQVDAGGTLNLYGGIISSRSVITINGTLKVRSGVITRPVGGTTWRVNVGTGATLDIDGLYSPSVRWAIAPGVTLLSKGFRVFDVINWEANGGPVSDFYIIRDQLYNGGAPGVNGAIDINNRTGLCWKVVNSEKGDGINSCANSGAQGVTEVTQEVSVNVRTFVGGPVDSPLWFARGYNNGNRKNYTTIPAPANTSYLSQGDDISIVVGDVNGDCPATPLINFVNVNNTGDANYSRSNVAPNLYDIRCDGGTRGSNVRTIYYKRYGSLPQTLKAAMLGIGGTFISVIDAADTSVTLSKSAALALIDTKVSVNIGTNTVTILSSCTLDELNDALKAYGSQSVIAQLEYPTSDTYPITASGTTLSSACNFVIAGGATLSNGSKFLSLSTSGSITITGSISVNSYTSVAGTFVKLSVTNLVAGSRVQFYNVTNALEVSNTIVAGTSYYVYLQYTSYKTIRMRAMPPVGATCYYLEETLGTLSSSGLSFTSNPQPNVVYNSNGIDGNFVTGVTWNTTSVDIDLSGLTTIGWRNLYASYCATLTTNTGISTFANLVSAPDAVTYIFDTAILFNNLSLTGVIVGGDGYGSHADGSYMGGTGNIQFNNGKAYIANSDQIVRNTNLIPALL